MAKRQSVTIGSRTFPSKKALQEECSKILNSGIDAAAEQFLRDLIERHPERDLKVGCGIQKFFIGPNEFGGQGFWILRSDGSRTDFSYKACITPPSREQQAKAAFRYAVRGQVIAFRDLAFGRNSRVPCALTGVPVSKDEAHVDHGTQQPFDAILNAFLEVEGISLEGVAVNATEDGDTTTRLLDQDLEQRWQSFHQQRAILRITTGAANLSQARKTSDPR